MKNRRLLIAVFLCFAMLVTGVGYATLSGHITVQGESSFEKTAADKGFIENIFFHENDVDKESNGSADTLQNTASASGQTATFTVADLATRGETATFTYTLENTNTVGAYISIKATHDGGASNPKYTPNYFEVTVVCGGSNDPNKVTMADTTITEEDGVYEGRYNANEGKTYFLAAGATVEVVVTVTLNRTPSTNVTPESYFMHLTATSVDNAVQPQ